TAERPVRGSRSYVEPRAVALLPQDHLRGGARHALGPAAPALHRAFLMDPDGKPWRTLGTVVATVDRRRHRGHRRVAHARGARRPLLSFDGRTAVLGEPQAHRRQDRQSHLLPVTGGPVESGRKRLPWGTSNRGRGSV